MPYPRSKTFGKNKSDPIVIGLAALFKVLECNHRNFCDGDQITPKGLETKSLKQIHSPDFVNDVDEGMFGFEQYRKAVYRP